LLGSANVLTARPEIQLKAISKLNSGENKRSNSTASEALENFGFLSQGVCNLMFGGNFDV